MKAIQELFRPTPDLARGAMLHQLPFGKVVGLGLAAAAILAGCSAEPAQSANAKTAPVSEAVPVTVSTAISKPVPVQVQANGSAQAISNVTLLSQVDGQVSQIHFTEGEYVKRGELLFTLDQRPFQAALLQAQGNLGRDTAQLQQAEAQLVQSSAAEKQAEANLERDLAQLANADAEARRYKELINDGAVSKEQYDQVRTAALAAQATVQADRAAVNNAKAAIGAAEATVGNVKAAIRADQAVVESARIQLGYASIRSPMEGRTGSLLVHVGSSVKARDTTSPLVVIDQLRPIYVSFSVPEQYLADIREYQAAGSLKVSVILPGQEDRPLEGALTFINNSVDPSTGTIQLKATFPNSDNRLWPGQFLNVVLTLTTVPHAVVVPSQAIQTGQQGSYVFVVRPDRTVEYRLITPGASMDGESIIEKGIAAGEIVVTEGQVRLLPGSRVDIKASGAGAGLQGAAA
jgi:multidrug efflux system membrane fusion protein